MTTKPDDFIPPFKHDGELNMPLFAVCQRSIIITDSTGKPALHVPGVGVYPKDKSKDAYYDLEATRALADHWVGLLNRSTESLE